MGFVDILRKLGIFRSGTTKQKYSDGTERSMALQQNDVFDEKKDIAIKSKPKTKVKAKSKK